MYELEITAILKSASIIREETMSSRCPKCGTHSVVAQDIESLSDSALLVKLEQRIQLTCQQCGWIEFDDPIISLRIETQTWSAV